MVNRLAGIMSSLGDQPNKEQCVLSYCTELAQQRPGRVGAEKQLVRRQGKEEGCSAPFAMLSQASSSLFFCFNVMKKRKTLSR